MKGGVSIARKKTKFVCTECGYETPRWMGKCTGCGEWNTLVEVIETAKKGGRSTAHMAGQSSRPMLLRDVTTDGEIRFSSGIIELNRVLGGGIVPGEMVLIGGDPGIGKSTLLLQMALGISSTKGVRTLYVTGEESVQQVKLRAERLGLDQGELLIVAETDTDLITSYTSEFKPQVVIIDSIQTLVTPDLSSSPGSVSQVRECTARLLRIAKHSDITFFLVGHVTKEGSTGSKAA